MQNIKKIFEESMTSNQETYKKKQVALPASYVASTDNVYYQNGCWPSVSTGRNCGLFKWNTTPKRISATNSEQLQSTHVGYGQLYQMIYYAVSDAPQFTASCSAGFSKPHCDRAKSMFETRSRQILWQPMSWPINL